MSNQNKDVPTKFVGKIEPNYYCRGWNETRQKYCRARAGQGTNHKGEGRCKNHGGNHPIKTGRYSTIKSRSRITELIEHFQKDENKLDLEDEVVLLRAMLQDYVERYDELSEAVIAWHASYSKDYLKVYEEWYSNWLKAIENPQSASLDDVLGPPVPHELKPKQILDISSAGLLIDRVGRMVERVEKLREGSSISMETFNRLLEQYGLSVALSVRENINDATERSKLIEDIERRWGEVRAN